jgi:hypothetical protein
MSKNICKVQTIKNLAGEVIALGRKEKDLLVTDITNTISHVLPSYLGLTQRLLKTAKKRPLTPNQWQYLYRVWEHLIPHICGPIPLMGKSNIVPGSVIAPALSETDTISNKDMLLAIRASIHNKTWLFKSKYKPLFDEILDKDNNNLELTDSDWGTLRLAYKYHIRATNNRYKGRGTRNRNTDMCYLYSLPRILHEREECMGEHITK